jgi:hypothetical protein
MSDNQPSGPPTSDFDIEQWLASIQLGQYASAFAENDISIETLAQLTSEDLKEIGVTSLGHRKTLLAEIQKLTAGGAPAIAPSAPLTPPASAETRIAKEKPAEKFSGAEEPSPRKPAAPPPKSATSAASQAPAASPVSVAAPASPAVPAPDAPKSRRGFWLKIAASKFLVVSILAHLFFGMGATYYIVQSIQTKRKLSFQGGPPNPNRSTRALEHKVSMAQKKKTGGAPPQTKRITSTGIAKVSLPEMPAMSTSTNAVPGSMLAGMGGAGFGAGMGFGSGMGSGMGGGMGGGGGAGINFFGLRTNAKRIAFLLDYSGSMDGPFRKAMERELEKALKALPPATQVILIPWAGPAWLHNQTAGQIMKKWKMVDPAAIDPYDNFVLLPDAKLDPPTWLSGGPTGVEEIMKGIRAQVAAPGGTDWRQPFRYAMEANPPPDVIFFMTDGQIPPKNAGRALSAIDEALKKAPRPPVVNCLYIENTLFDGSEMKKLAHKYQGEFRKISAGSASKD